MLPFVLYMSTSVSCLKKLTQSAVSALVFPRGLLLYTVGPQPLREKNRPVPKFSHGGPRQNQQPNSIFLTGSTKTCGPSSFSVEIL